MHTLLSLKQMFFFRNYVTFPRIYHVLIFSFGILVILKCVLQRKAHFFVSCVVSDLWPCNFGLCHLHRVLLLWYLLQVSFIFREISGTDILERFLYDPARRSFPGTSCESHAAKLEGPDSWTHIPTLIGRIHLDDLHTCLRQGRKLLPPESGPGQCIPSTLNLTMQNSHT